MNVGEFKILFNRALSLTFSKKKLLLAFFALLFCGLLIGFSRGVAVNAGCWMGLSLTFLPFFLCAGVFLSIGILLIRVYHDEIKKSHASFNDVFNKSWEVVIGASYFSIPIILTYLLFWMALGIFFLLKEIPVVGDFFAVILAFGPFLLNLGTILLCLLNIAMLFFITPVVALKNGSHKKVLSLVIQRIKNDLFTNSIFAVIALFPALIIFSLLYLAAMMTESIYLVNTSSLHIVLQWMFIMIPFNAILSPTVVFFFNFAAEAHVYFQKIQKETLSQT